MPSFSIPDIHQHQVALLIPPIPAPNNQASIRVTRPPTPVILLLPWVRDTQHSPLSNRTVLILLPLLRITQPVLLNRVIQVLFHQFLQLDLIKPDRTLLALLTLFLLLDTSHNNKWNR